METRILETLSSGWPSLLLLALSAVPASYMHAKDHGKLKGLGRAGGFFSNQQDMRKWMPEPGFKNILFTPAPNTWYYRFFKLAYKEKFPLSATFLVLYTDAYHASQALMRILMSLSITLAMNVPWWWAGLIWAAYATVHAIFYKLLSR